MNRGQFIPKWKYGSKNPTYLRTYRCWNNMNSRCYRENDVSYPNYGERGIVVCDRWRESFDLFIEDMGLSPIGKTLDRIDTNGNYEPSNCRWATKKEQANNTRNNIFVTYNKETRTLTEWAEFLDLKVTRLHSRIRAGWKFEDAIKPEKYEAPHGSARQYTLGCRCEVCKSETSIRSAVAYRKKNPIVKNKSKHNPEKQQFTYDL